jgi:hypothetical protein
MDFLKIKKFRKSQKAGVEKDLVDKAVPEPEESKPNTGVSQKMSILVLMLRTTMILLPMR